MGGGPTACALLVPALVALATRPAAAEPVMLAERWPSVPAGPVLTLEAQLTDRLTELGNLLGHHLVLLSNDMVQLRFDGRRRRARVRLGGGSDALQIRLSGDIEFDDLNARVRARIELGLGGRLLHLALPDFEMSPAEYRGDYGVEVRVPIFVKTF